MEEYRIIENIEVSNLGNCKSKLVRSGEYICVSGTKKTLHVLVAKAFPDICGYWFDGCDVHHIDHNKLNNQAENLIVMSKYEHHKLHNASRFVSEKNKRKNV